MRMSTINCVKQATIFLLALFLAASAVIFVRHLTKPSDLANMLTDATSLKDLRIYYDESHDAFFVHGDRRLVLQKWRPDGIIGDGGIFVPTCTSTASQQEIESLVRLMIQRHFVELPQKGFPSYVGTAEGFPLHLHTIVVYTKTKHGVWVFETGELNGKRESIPPDFVAVEDNLRKLKSAMTGTPCPNAPEIKLQF
jgi:hypothetical protein